MSTVVERPSTGSQLRIRALELLPDEDADVAEYLGLAEGLMEIEAERSVLVAALAELRRRSVPEDSPAEIAQAAHALQAEILTADAGLRAQEVKAREEHHPLWANLLSTLGDTPGTTPSELADLLDVSKEAVSRGLQELARAGLVAYDADTSDKRRRLYRVQDDAATGLTVAGEIERSRHMRYGAPPRRDHDREQRDFEKWVRDAIDVAVEARRRENDLEKAIDELKALVSTCCDAGLWPLEMKARRELATSLRQSRRRREHRSQVRQLEKLARGARPGMDPQLVMPAFGHFLYEMGRSPSRPSDRTSGRHLRMLQSSAQAFENLAAIGEHEDWVTYRAWALFALADLRRQQTELEGALEAAFSAAQLFGDIDDSYGLASSAFLTGFCLRLRGDFNAAEAVLSQAHAWTEEKGFRRLKAECLMQLGETRRSLGDLGGALSLLLDASLQAEQLSHTVTHAFAQSSLGAVFYELDEIGRAHSHFGRAERFFKTSDHRLGAALNHRRYALVKLGRPERATKKRLGTTLHMLGVAQRRFSYLDSPAGVAACKLDRIRVLEGAVGSAQVRRECVELAGWFERVPGVEEYVAGDPWVRPALAELLKRVDSDELASVSQRVQKKEREREKEREQMRPDHVDEFGVVHKLAAESQTVNWMRNEVDRMGGEPRRRPVIAGITAEIVTTEG